MNRMHRPAASQASRSHLLATFAALAAAVVLVIPLAAAPARAAWTPETPVAGVYNTRPALAMDTGGHLGIAWERDDAAPGIFFASDATGSWVTERASAGADGLPDLVFDGAGKAHVVFVREGAGLYYATNVTGTWVTTLLRSDATPWSPSIAIDKLGKLHVAYSSEGFAPGIWYFTNASGAWVTTRLTTSTWDSEPSLVLDAANKVRIAFVRYDPSALGIYVLSNATGSWVASRATSGPSIDDYPALGIDAAGKLHVAAVRYDADWNASLLYLTNATGAWVTTVVGLPTGLTETGIPALGFDGSGNPEIVAGAYGDDSLDTLFRYTGAAMATSEALFAADESSPGLPDILRDGTGRLTVAYRGAWHAPGLRLHREDPDAETLIAPSVLVELPSLGQDGTGDRYLAFERFATDAKDGTSLATDAGGSWADSRLGATHGLPDLAFAGANPYVAIPDRLYWDAGGGWQEHAFQVASGSAAAVAAGATSLVAYATDAGIRVVDGSLNEEQATNDSRDASPDVALLVGSYQAVVAFVRDGALYAVHRGAAWGVPELVDALDSAAPSIAAIGASDVAILAWDRNDTNPGIYAAWGPTTVAPWEPVRLSRSWADNSPAVVRDEAGTVFVTWARACWGASPGIYLATTRSGTWAVTQLVASCDVTDPSIAILPGGLASVAYTNGAAGITTVTESSITAAGRALAGSPATGPARGIDAVDARPGSLAPANAGPAPARVSDHRAPGIHP